MPRPLLKVQALEGLRGFLAWTVVFTHAALLAGFVPREMRGPLRQLLDPHQAVDVFIILSGFVISLLVVRQQESYWRYIFRRFLRLYPALVATLLIAQALKGISLGALEANAGRSVVTAQILAAHQAGFEKPWPNWLAHLTLTHGLIPSAISNEAATAILSPAWSVGLEWQFYLVLPSVMVACRNRYGLGC